MSTAGTGNSGHSTSDLKFKRMISHILNVKSKNFKKNIQIHLIIFIIIRLGKGRYLTRGCFLRKTYVFPHHHPICIYHQIRAAGVSHYLNNSESHWIQPDLEISTGVYCYPRYSWRKPTGKPTSDQLHRLNLKANCLLCLIEY